MEQPPSNDPRHPHEEEIVPVRPGLAGGATRVETPPPRRRPSASLVTGVAAAVLLVAALGVFFLLPGWVEQRAPARVAEEPAPAVPAEPAEPALTEEQLAALQEEADGLLADLLTQQQSLAAASASSWGAEDWQRYETLSRAGDDAYLAEDFRAAVDSYTEALTVGERLLERSADIAQTALNAGRSALEAGNPQLALEQFELVLRIDGDNEAAEAGRARAEKLPDVLDATRRGDTLRQQDQLEEAAEAFRAALAIDADWTPARRALEGVERELADRRFEALMSDGYRALADESYDDAEAHFRDALAMRPQSAEARDGIVQAEQGMHLDQIALAEARALAFERRELWRQAIEQYEAALETDDSLAFAKQGLERARARADLDVKLANLIENPNLLFGDAVLDSAKALVGEAESLVAESDGANTRLRGQIEELTRLIELASTPVTVALRSDGQTHVTLYRVGELGLFEAIEVELRPGNYTALGSREGYRDVRETFTVLPGREPAPVSVICVEPI
ncbi:MAG: tetratricopeptide repeat protein [Gammaproteobacteria bacterium]|nr:tetratricopeptide repeat protein [Gammaproteobacteria bacterium]